MLTEGYLDADGVQDVYYECSMAVQTILKKLKGEEVDQLLVDPGFVIHQGNFEEAAEHMWGAKVYERANGKLNDK